MAFIPEIIINTVPGDNLKVGADKINNNFDAIAEEFEGLSVPAVTYGTTSGTACEGNDSRLSNARTAIAHASSHKSGGGDALDGDVIDISYTPENYTPDAVTDITTLDNELTSHLKGIDDALASAGVADDSVTLAKLEHGTQGDILYYGATGTPTRLSAGTSGYYLKTQGAGANPIWAEVVGGTGGGIDPVTVTAGEALAQYALVYVNSSDKAMVARCDGSSAESDALGMVTESGGIAEDETGSVVVLGSVTYGSWTWTPFKWIYLSTDGGLTQTLTTTNGQYAVPVAIALSATQIYIQPMTGWVVNNNDNIALGCKKVTFSNSSGVVSIVTPPANAVLTQITVVVSDDAASSGGTIKVGTASNDDAYMATTVVDLTQVGNHVYDLFAEAGASPDEIILTVTAGGQTFSGSLYLHWSIPNQFTGLGGVASISFTQATSSPALITNLPSNVVVTRCTVVVDTAASTGSPTISIGPNGDADALFDETDCDLLTQGIYLYDPFIEQSGSIYVTITPDSQSFAGRVYVQYMAVS